MLNQLFRSVMEQDSAPIVICDTEHTIVYMNPAAATHYERFGGSALLGKCLLECHNERSIAMIRKVLAWFQADPAHNCVHTFYNPKENKDVYMIALRDENNGLIGYYEKHEYRNVDPTPLYAM